MRKLFFFLFCIYFINKCVCGDEDSVFDSVDTSVSSSATKSSTVGEVIWTGSGCSYAILETNTNYVLVETYSGYLYAGQRVKAKDGNFHSYGFRDARTSSDSDVRLYVENYYGSKTSCFDWLKSRGKCGIK